MNYRIEWGPKYAVKHFWGQVTFEDIHQSEIEIQSSPKFDDLRFIISIFDGTTALALSKSDSDLILALRLGAMNTNPRLRYAYVCCNATAETTVEESIKNTNLNLPILKFDRITDAMEWAKT